MTTSNKKTCTQFSGALASSVPNAPGSNPRCTCFFCCFFIIKFLRAGQAGHRRSAGPASTRGPKSFWATSTEGTGAVDLTGKWPVGPFVWGGEPLCCFCLCYSRQRVRTSLTLHVEGPGPGISLEPLRFLLWLHLPIIYSLALHFQKKWGMQD
jgi:hypothetical protein